MAETVQETTDVKAQYGAQVAADLERNTAEQARIRAEVTALGEQLQALQHDHTLLLGVQQVLHGQDSPPDSPDRTGTTVEGKTAGVPRPRTARAAAEGKGVQKGAQKTAAAKSGRNTVARGRSPKASAQPTLVALVREHLDGVSEPRSAAEITAALTQLHTGRDVKSTAVRTTLEGLVAKGQAHRAKQGSSVFYSASGRNTALPAEAPATE